ncbi:MAG: alpha/beta hydrolase [Chloroflexota bacterium]
MKKTILILVVVLLLALVGGGVWFWNAMQQPLYEPGMVRAGKNLRAPLAPPAQSADKNFWMVENDIKLFHFADGAGTNVLVVHGGPGFPFTEPIAGLKSLTNNYRFHYYDQRGSGKSSRPIDKFTSSNFYENMQTLDRTLGLGVQIADIERIRQILGDEKIILVGHSFGGFIASLYAAEFPERVQALILIAPAEMLIMPPESGGLFEQVKPLLPESMRSKYDDYVKRLLNFGNLFSQNETDLAALNREFVPYYEAALKAKGVTIPASNLPNDNGGWMVQAMYMSMGIKHDYRAALKSVSAPVLVIHGDKDLQPEQASRMYSDLFPNGKFQVIQNATHLPFSEQPEAFARVVSEFLGKK